MLYHEDHEGHEAVNVRGVKRFTTKRAKVHEVNQKGTQINADDTDLEVESK